VVIGVDLAKKLQVSVGGELISVGQGSDGSTANDLFTVVGIVKTGNLGTDKAGVFLHVADLQEFLVMGDQLHEILALTYDEEEIATFVGEIQDTFKADQLMTDAEDETLGVYPWWETNKQMAEMLAMQDSAIGIMIFLILMVSGFGILNTMMMSVFERTRELGVIRALGISRPRMVLVVVMESVVLAAFACLVGLAMGGVLSLYLTVVGLDFSVKDGEGFSFAGVVFDPIFKGVISANDFVTPVLAVFVISALASLWPATRAAFLRPVEALRQD
jgi:ABC-type lipoprotein release transport system permease subunit